MRQRPILHLLKEKQIPFEIVGGGAVPCTAPSIEFRQYNHVCDSYLVVRVGDRWGVEFYDSGYVLQVVHCEPDENHVVQLFESIMDHSAFAYCPVADHSQDQALLLLNPVSPSPPRRRPEPHRSLRGIRLTARQRVRLLAHEARRNLRPALEALAVRGAWLIIGLGVGAAWLGNC